MPRIKKKVSKNKQRGGLSLKVVGGELCGTNGKIKRHIYTANLKKTRKGNYLINRYMKKVGTVIKGSCKKPKRTAPTTPEDEGPEDEGEEGNGGEEGGGGGSPAPSPQPEEGGQVEE
jgi:hypothetical protein